MKDSARPPLHPQVSGPPQSDEKSLLAALHEQLGEYEGELEATPKPDPDDFSTKAQYDSARLGYNLEIRGIWDKIHKLMALWPPGV